MKLLMYISNDLIDCIPLEEKKIIYPGYIRSFIRMLKEKHGCLISRSTDEPEFLIHEFSTGRSINEKINATEQPKRLSNQ